MEKELHLVKKILHATKKKKAINLRHTVLMREMIASIYEEYPVTFTICTNPGITLEEIYDMGKRVPSGKKELAYFGISV